MSTIFKIIPRLSLELADGSFFDFIRILIQLEFFVITRKLGIIKKDFRFSYIQNNINVNLFLQKTIDIAVLKELYIQKEYAWFPIKNPQVIIDLGAHFGDTTLYYHAQYPDAKIIAVEPSPTSFERLKKHVADIPQIIPVCAAVGAYDGDVMFNITESSLGNSLVERESTIRTVSVPQMTLRTLFKTYNIERADILKFDIEGGEFSLFDDSPTQYARAYIGEVHGDLSDTPVDIFFDIFKNFQCERIPLSNKRRFILRALNVNS